MRIDWWALGITFIFTRWTQAEHRQGDGIGFFELSYGPVQGLLMIIVNGFSRGVDIFRLNEEMVSAKGYHQ